MSASLVWLVSILLTGPLALELVAPDPKVREAAAWALEVDKPPDERGLLVRVEVTEEGRVRVSARRKSQPSVYGSHEGPLPRVAARFRSTALRSAVRKSLRGALVDL